MERKTAFIGHRQVCFIEKVKERLQNAIEQCINDGCSHFLMGTHGEFDKMALDACRFARKQHPNINIEVVLTSYHIIEKKAELTNKLKILTNELATAQKETADLNKFMRLVKRYTEITELSPEIVRTFIDKIYVHKGEKAQGGHRQTIEIIYNCVGAVPEMENNRTETNSLDNKSGL